MKKSILFLLLFPILAFGNDKEIPTEIKEVTVYLSGAQIIRTAHLQLKSGTSAYVFTGLSPKIDESSIQVSGLKSVSILSMAYAIDYLTPSADSPEVTVLESKIKTTNQKISRLKNRIAGLEEEQKVIGSNRLISGENVSLDLDNIKQISIYYRERITTIKNEIFTANLEIDQLQSNLTSFQNQRKEIDNAPIKEFGEIRLKFDAPIATVLNLQISYTIQDAGWIPNYDIKSKKLNDPLRLTYKAHVYQKTGIDWKNVKINLSSGSPTLNVAKPVLGTKYLDFVSRYTNRYENTTKKQKYFYNPTVKKVTGQITDGSGLPLPGANVLIKGTSHGTTTDFDGIYEIDIQEGRKLAYSYIGFKSMEIPVYSSVMNLRLEEDAAALDEVVVTAMATKKSYTTGYAVSTIDMENALQGRTAGVQIRGASSVGGYSRPPEPKLPLYIIDGVPSEGFVEGDLDENEIQSIEVLKVESTKALYGSRGANGVVMITTKKSRLKEGATNTLFEIKKPYSIPSNSDITAIELDSFQLNAEYEYFAAPIVNGNVFMTATFKDWEHHNLLPGEANIYFEGTFTGKTTIDPHTTKREMTLSLGIDPNITVTRKQHKNFKSKSFMGHNRILNRTYELAVKNNKSVSIDLRLMDRIPLSQNKDIKVDDIVTNNAEFNKKKGLLTWKMQLAPKENKTETFSFQVKYPKYRTISL